MLFHGWAKTKKMCGFISLIMTVCDGRASNRRPGHIFILSDKKHEALTWSLTISPLVYLAGKDGRNYNSLAPTKWTPGFPQIGQNLVKFSTIHPLLILFSVTLCASSEKEWNYTIILLSSVKHVICWIRWKLRWTFLEYLWHATSFCEVGCGWANSASVVKCGGTFCEVPCCGIFIA